MPELPEVETIKRELSRKLSRKTVSGVEILWAKTVAPSTSKTFKNLIVGQKVSGLERRAKMLFIHFENKVSLAIHLKMTGQLIFVPPKGHPITDKRHTRLIFHFRDGGTLYFNDLRKFGWVRILDKKLRSYLETEVGVEPLSKKFTLKSFEKILERFPNRTVKQVLLDQKLIAGIGNIYADESVHLSGLLPMRKISSLKSKDIVILRENIVTILKLSIKNKGTSSKNYRRSNGEMGGFVKHLKVYGRVDQTCKKCGEIIKKTRHAGRGTHYCPTCQS